MGSILLIKIYLGSLCQRFASTPIVDGIATIEEILTFWEGLYNDWGHMSEGISTKFKALVQPVQSTPFTVIKTLYL